MQDASVERWDGKTVGAWKESLEGASAVINTVGESVFTHWTDEKKKRMMGSRVDSTKAIGDAIAQCKSPPAVWVNASAVGYYGSVYDPAYEQSPNGKDFLAEICRRWEAAQHESNTHKITKCQARIGFVLGKYGGAFPMLKKLTKVFLGSAQGSGKQYMAWIHVDDIAGAFRFCVDHKLEGPINLCGPQPVTNAELMKKLRKAMHRPGVPNVPKFALALGSAFALPPTEVTLASQNVMPTRLQALGFEWKFSNLDLAIENLVE